MEIDLGMIKFVQNIYGKKNLCFSFFYTHRYGVHKNYADKIPFYMYESRISSISSVCKKSYMAIKFFSALIAITVISLLRPTTLTWPCRCISIYIRRTWLDAGWMLLSRLPAFNVYVECSSCCYSSIEYLPNIFCTIQSIGYEWSLSKSLRKLWLVSGSLVEVG